MFTNRSSLSRLATSSSNPTPATPADRQPRKPGPKATTFRLPRWVLTTSLSAAVLATALLGPAAPASAAERDNKSRPDARPEARPVQLVRNDHNDRDNDHKGNDRGRDNDRHDNDRDRGHDSRDFRPAPRVEYRPEVRHDSRGDHDGFRGGVSLGVRPSGGYYTTQYQQVLVTPGHYDSVWCPPVTEVRYDSHRHPYTVEITAGHYDQVWCGPVYASQPVQVWVPAAEPSFFFGLRF